MSLAAKDGVAQSADMAMALVHRTQSSEQPNLRDWQVLVEATGYGSLLQEFHRCVTGHMRSVVSHWATLDVLPTWLEEAAEKGREGYLAAWREKLEEDGWFDPKLPDRRESCYQEARRNLLGGSFEILIRSSHAVVESVAPSVVDEIHHRWVKEVLQAARPGSTHAGHILDNVPVGQNAMHAKREHEIFKRMRWLHATLAVDEADVLHDRPYQGSIYALPYRARQLETEATVRLLSQTRDHARDAIAFVETRAEEKILAAEENVLAVRGELNGTLAELEYERNARLLREGMDRREMQNMTSEHNAAMLREAMRVREEEVRAGENQAEMANALSDMHAAKVRYEEQQRIYQEAAATSEETRDALRTAQRRILDLRKELLDVKAEPSARELELDKDVEKLRRKVEELESSRVTLVRGTGFLCGLGGAGALGRRGRGFLPPFHVTDAVEFYSTSNKNVVVIFFR